MRMNLFPRLMFAFFLFAVIAFSIVVVSYFANKQLLVEWLEHPAPPGRIYHLPSGHLYAHLKGEGNTTVVFLSGLGASSVEWWDIQNKLSGQMQTLTYDRPGYAWSLPTVEVNIDKQSQLLVELLQKLNIDDLTDQSSHKKRTILVGHNLGANIAHHINQLYGTHIKAAIYIDPMINPSSICHTQVDSEWKNQFIDQTLSLERYEFASRLGFFRFLNLTPYDVPDSIRQAVLNNLANPQTAEIVLKEYSDIVNIPSTKTCIDTEPFECTETVDQKRIMIQHNESQSQELMKGFGAPEETATMIETLVKQNNRQYLCTPSSITIEAKKSVFDIHINEPEIIINAIQSVSR